MSYSNGPTATGMDAAESGRGVQMRFVMHNQAAIDAIGVVFAGSRRFNMAFQVTLADDHTIDAAGLEKAAEVSGATETDPLQFYLVVPSGRTFDAWSAKQGVAVPATCLSKVQVFVVKVAKDIVPAERRSAPQL